MKILLISPLPPPEGGIATWTVQYAEYCKNNGLELEIVNIALTGRRANKINDKKSLLDEMGRCRRIFKDLKARLKSFKPDVVHLNSSCSPLGLMRDYVCVRMCKAKKAPIVFHCRCNIADRLQSNKLAKWFFKKCVRSSSRVLTLNTPSREYTEQAAGVKALTVSNYISCDGIPRINGIKERIENVAFTGHVQFDKGIRELFCTAESFKDITFHVIGPVSDEVKQMTPPSNVRLYGNTKHGEALKRMSECDLFLFPSYTEGFSNSMVEAMAIGLPIIATDVGANADMIEQFGGRIVSAQNAEAIIREMSDMNDPSQRARMSEWNVQKVNNSYKIEIVFSKLLEIYSKVICEHREK